MIDFTEQAKADFARRKEKFGLEDFNNEFGFEPILALKPEEPGEMGTIHYVYKAKSTHRNVLGTLHGGVIASILDGGMGQGAAILKRCSLNTITLTVTYLEASRGLNYRVEVDYTHLGDRIVDAIARFYDCDHDDLLCASAMGSFIVLAPRMPY